MNISLLILRLVIGVVFLYHGSSKLKNSKMMAQDMGMPSMMPFILGLLESIAGLGLILGIFVEIFAIFLGIVMLGAIFMKIFKWHMPFAISQKPGWSIDLIILASIIVIYFSGASYLGI